MPIKITTKTIKDESFLSNNIRSSLIELNIHSSFFSFLTFNILPFLISSEYPVIFDETQGLVFEMKSFLGLTGIVLAVMGLWRNVPLTLFFFLFNHLRIESRLSSSFHSGRTTVRSFFARRYRIGKNSIE